jgi:hypothetical protein
MGSGSIKVTTADDLDHPRVLLRAEDDNREEGEITDSACAPALCVALGCLCAFLYLAGLFPVPPTPPAIGPARYNTRVSASFDPVLFVGGGQEI